MSWNDSVAFGRWIGRKESQDYQPKGGAASSLDATAGAAAVSPVFPQILNFGRIVQAGIT